MGLGTRSISGVTEGSEGREAVMEGGGCVGGGHGEIDTETRGRREDVMIWR